MKNHVSLYFCWMLVCILAIGYALQSGKKMEPVTVVIPQAAIQGSVQSSTSAIAKILDDNAKEPLSRLFLQLIIIICATRFIGSIFGRMGQPVVVGEMIAGMLLGPSLFGWVMPSASAFVFEPKSLGSLGLLSLIGVCLFLFVVGMNLEVELMRQRIKVAVLVSHISIVFPFMLGVLSALYLYKVSGLEHVSFLSFALFMGISMSITAFPVLARIVEERGLTKTLLGSTALTCALIGDVTAWILLAFIVAVAKSTAVAGAVFSLGLAILFILVMVFAIKPQLAHWFNSAQVNGEDFKKSALARILLFVLASALFTHVIGIHALFGAFLAGVVIPGDIEFRHWLQVRIESFTSTFLLPIFFAFTGLRTNIGLLNDQEGVLLCLAVIAIATLGKLGGTALMARLTGISWIESFRLGALMNTRGLMELIALNIGYDLHILSARIFTMLVIMALVTTLMTGPLLTLSDKFERKVPV